jgi:hypothetical protein
MTKLSKTQGDCDKKLQEYLGHRLSDDECSMAYGMLSLGKSIRDTAKEMGLSKSTLLRKITDSPARLGQYRATLEAKALYHAAEIIDIADDDGIPVDRAKLMVHARQWDASKILSKIGLYGDASSGQGANLTNVNVAGGSQIVIQAVPLTPIENGDLAQQVIDAEVVE